jgi:hypothetical protein
MHGWRDNIKMDLRVGGHELDSSSSEEEPVTGSFEHGNELSGSIKPREFLDQLSVLAASQEELCSMELDLPFLILQFFSCGCW